MECTVCGRQFRRKSDKACHKCSQERRRPVREQKGAVRCDVCGRWFRSRGGLAVHRCVREEGAGGQDSSSDTSAGAGAQQVQSGQDERPDRSTVWRVWQEFPQAWRYEKTQVCGGESQTSGKAAGCSAM